MDNWRPRGAARQRISIQQKRERLVSCNTINASSSRLVDEGEEWWSAVLGSARVRSATTRPNPNDGLKPLLNSTLTLTDLSQLHDKIGGAAEANDLHLWECAPKVMNDSVFVCCR